MERKDEHRREFTRNRRRCGWMEEGKGSCAEKKALVDRPNANVGDGRSSQCVPSNANAWNIG